MSLSMIKRRPPDEDLASDDVPLPSPAPAQSPAMKWTGGASLATRGITLALWAAVACGPLTLGYLVLSPPQSAVPVSSDDRLTQQSVVAGEQGVAVVGAWLGATRDDHAELSAVLSGVDTSDLPKTPTSVRNLAVASSEQADGGVWAVTVGADVQVVVPATDGSTSSTWQHRYFGTSVVVEGVAARVLTLPAPVPAPVAATAPDLDYAYELSTTGQLASTAQGFLAAMLTGQGDISRFERPGVDVVPLTPAPYRAVSISSISSSEDVSDTATPQDGARTRVQVVVVLEREDGQSTTAQYQLDYIARGGRWEVSALAIAPATQPASVGSGQPATTN